MSHENNQNNACVVLFSGGTDSTLATVLQLEKFETTRLVTFDRLGIASVENSKINAQMLIDKYGKDRVVHSIINFDKTFKFLSYERYFKNLFKHGLMNLSTCGICKLGMHIHAIMYCKENNIVHVSDGANQGMDMFPAQMKPIIEQLKKLYSKYDIDYSNPVFEYEYPDEGSFISMENSNMLTSFPTVDAKKESFKKTAGQILFDKGLAPLPNVKGSSYDKKRQPRCFQFILFKMFANKYFLSSKTYEECVDQTVVFFKDKINAAEKLITKK